VCTPTQQRQHVSAMYIYCTCTCMSSDVVHKLPAAAVAHHHRVSYFYCCLQLVTTMLTHNSKSSLVCMDQIDPAAISSSNYDTVLLITSTFGDGMCDTPLLNLNYLNLYCCHTDLTECCYCICLPRCCFVVFEVTFVLEFKISSVHCAQAHTRFTLKLCSNNIYRGSCGHLLTARSGVCANYCSTNNRAHVICSSVVAYSVLRSRSMQAIVILYYDICAQVKLQQQAKSSWRS
jgi:hypothetical protein